MAGEAKTAQFLLATATLMLGPQEDVFALTPAEHSVGLVKNVQMQTQPRFTELMQGVTGQLVYSVNTENPVTVSQEVYEYTARNIAYAVGIDAHGAGFDPISVTHLLSADVEDSDTSITLAGTTTMPVAGDWLAMSAGAGSDNIFVFRAGTITSRAIAIPTEFVLPAGVTWDKDDVKVYKVSAIKVGTQESSGFLGAKVVGVLPEQNEPVTIIFPKVRITNGLNLNFQTDNFSNMPFEFKPYALLPSDPFYADFAGNKSSMILRR